MSLNHIHWVREGLQKVYRVGLVMAVLVVAAGEFGAGASGAPGEVGPAARERIEKALPEKAPAAARKPRRLLIFDLNVGYGGHPSIPTANLAFTLMGTKTGAYKTEISRDPFVFRRENLKRFDAVFLNNTVGNLFEDPELRQNLIDFVYGGGGLLGVHGTTVAFTRWPGAHEDWPEFGIMLGARGANHRESTERVFLKLDDAHHPVNRVFGGNGFEYRDEFFRYHEVYSRRRVRVLLSIDTVKTDLNQGPARGTCLRADNDYALAWVRGYGRGRVFHCTIAHNPYVFWDRKMLEFYLAAVQFALGDLDAPTTPSAALTPAVRARERLGWRLGLAPGGFQSPSGKVTLFEAIEKADELGLLYIGGENFQRVSRAIPKPFDERLSPEELRKIRLKLDAAGVRLLTYRIARPPFGEDGWQKIFEFGRKMGIEAVIAEPPAVIAEPPAALLDRIERLCDTYDIKLAITSGEGEPSSSYRTMREVFTSCRNRSNRIGIYGNPVHWRKQGIDPADAVGMLRERLFILQIDDPGKSTRNNRKDSSGDEGGIDPLAREIHRLGLRPIMFSIEYPPEGFGEMKGMARCIDNFNRISIRLAKRGD